MTKKTLLVTAASLSLIGSAVLSIDSFARNDMKGHAEGARMALEAYQSAMRFTYKDTDGNGALSLEEFSATSDHEVPDGQDEDVREVCMEAILGYALPDRPDSATAFDAADINDDGALDRIEFQVASELRAEARFAEIDVDADGRISGHERLADEAMRQQLQEARRICLAEQLDLDDDTEITLTYPIVDTNQGTCYNNSDLIDCPAEDSAFYGQDAQYTGAVPSYTDNGDGSVTDNVTGLIWTQAISSYAMPWSDASGYCASLETGNVSDWRLPSVKELWSIRDFSTGWPWVDTDYFYLVGDGSSLSQHHSWTSNLYLVESEYQNEQVQGDPAWIVNDWTGHIKAMSGSRFVRCVSGDEYGVNDFVDNGDGTVSDNATGLMWMQNDSGYSMNWEAALDYAENATIAGYDDWRLPNAKEIQSIVDYSGVFPAIDTSVFNLSELTNVKDQTDYPFYWTSTSNPVQGADDGSTDGGKIYAWVLAFGYNTDMDGYDLHGAGSVVFDTKAEAVSDGSGIEVFYHHVRLVRGGAVTETPDGDSSTYRGDDETRIVVFEDGDTGGAGGDAQEGQPDFAAAAEQLGVTEDALIAALGEPGQGEPDYETAAAALGVTVEALQAALMENSAPTE